MQVTCNKDFSQAFYNHVLVASSGAVACWLASIACWSPGGLLAVASGAGWLDRLERAGLAGLLRCWLASGHGLDRIDRRNGLGWPLAGLGWLAGGLDRPEATRGDREAGRRQRREGKEKG